MTIDLSNSTYQHETAESAQEKVDEFKPYVDETEAADRAAAALSLLFQYSQIDGSHHKTWSIDQVARILAGDKYEAFVKYYTNEDAGDEDELWEWDKGIAP